GDGVLDLAEAACTPTPDQVQRLLAGNPYITVPLGRRVGARTEMDADGDGKVTRAEFLAFHRAQITGPVTVSIGVNYNLPGPVPADRLFELLDTNRDGKLSKAELDAAEKVLMPLDQNDDELLSFVEIQGRPDTGFPYTPVLVRPGMRGPSAPVTLRLIRLDEGRRQTGRLEVAREVVARYDKDRDGKLSNTEVALTAAEFARLDTNRDGKLDVLEVLRWLGKPDQE